MSSWIIDTDAGIDDAQALILLLTRPNINISAITCVNGNVNVNQVYKNVKEICRICNRHDIPIYKGSDRALLQPPQAADNFHGVDGLGEYWRHKSLAQGDEIPDQTESAQEAIVRIVRQQPGTNVLLIGPMTNLAIAMTFAPDLQFGKIVAMAGTYAYDGNETVVAEYNVYTDPEAVAIVLERCNEMTIVPWETVCKINDDILKNHQFFNQYTGFDNPKSNLLKIMSDFVKRDGDDFVCDAIAAAFVIDPDLARYPQIVDGKEVMHEPPKRKVEIELGGRKTRGQFIIYWDNWQIFRETLWGVKKEDEKFTIIDYIDVPRFLGYMLESAQ